MVQGLCYAESTYPLDCKSEGHFLLLSERILQISPGKSDNLPLMTTTSTVWGSGSIGLSLVAQGRPPQASLVCGFCPLA